MGMVGSAIADNQTLPSIDTLKTLPVELVLDLTDHPDIASPAMPVIGKKGDLFFYDYKLKQLFKTQLIDTKLIPISRSGEGPKEYVYIKDMYIADDALYIIDMKQKLLCFGLDGTFRWEIRTKKWYQKILGVKGETFYLVENDLISDTFSWALYQWEKGEKSRFIGSWPMFYMRGNAIDESGKVMRGGGIFTMATPPICLSLEKNLLLTAVENQYKIDFLDLNGTIKKTVRLKAQPPQLSEKQKAFGKMVKEQIFSVMAIFCESPYIIVIANYFKEGRPRVDFFNLDGVLKHSFLMPERVDSQADIFSSQNRSAVFSNGYLLYFDPETVGFKIFRLKL